MPCGKRAAARRGFLNQSTAEPLFSQPQNPNPHQVPVFHPAP